MADPFWDHLRDEVQPQTGMTGTQPTMRLEQRAPGAAPARPRPTPQGQPGGGQSDRISFFERLITPDHDDFITSYGLQTGMTNMLGGVHKLMGGVEEMIWPGLAERLSGQDVPEIGAGDVVTRKVQAAKDIVTGLMGIIGAFPVAAPAAMVGEMLERKAPGLATMTVLPEWARAHTPYVRALMGEDPGKPGSEDMARMSRPLTVRDLVEFGVMLTAPTIATTLGGKVPKGKKPPATKLGEPAKGEAAPATFLGYQEQIKGKPVPLYNLTKEAKGRPKGDTVTGETLREMGFEPPEPMTEELSTQLMGRLAEENSIPPAGAVGNRVFGINWRQLGVSEQTKRVIIEVNRQLSEQGRTVATEGARSQEQGGPGRQTHEATAAKAAEMRLKVEDVLNIPALPAAIKTMEDFTAFQAGVKAVHEAAARSVDATFQLARAGDPIARADFKAAAALFGEISLKQKDLGTIAGQFLEARKVDPEMVGLAHIGASMREFEANVEKLHGMVDTDTMLGQYEQMTAANRPQRSTWIGNMWSAVKDGSQAGAHVIRDIWYNDLLTPVSIGKKTASDILKAAWDTGETAIGRMNAWALRFPGGGRTEALAPGETMIQLRGRFEGYRQAISNIREKKEIIDIYSASGYKGRPRALETPEWLEGSPLGLASNAIIETLYAPGTAIGAITEVARSGAAGGELHALALRRAYFEGRRGDALADRVAHLASHVADLGPDAVRQITLAGQRGTYTQEIGPAGQGLWDFISRGHLRWDVPFFRILWNLAKDVTHITPFLNTPSILNGEMRQQWAMGGAARQKMVAKVEMGLVLASLFAAYTAAGKMRGEGPANPALQEYAKRFGKPRYTLDTPFWDGALQYDHILPVGGLMGVTSTFVEMMAQHPSDEDTLTRFGEGAVTIGMAWAHLLGNMPMASGIAHTVELIDPRNRRGQDQRIRTFVNSFARGLVPGTLRTMNREWADRVVRDARTPIDAMKAVTPGMSQDIPPHLDRISGEDFYYPPAVGPENVLGVSSIISPVYYHTESTAYPRVYKFLYDNGIVVDRVPDHVQGPGEPFLEQGLPDPKRGFTLNPWQKYRWTKLMTQQIRNGDGQTFIEELHARMDRQYPNGFVNASTTAAESMVKNRAHWYREAALRLLQETDPELRTQMTEKRMEHLRLRYLPTTDPRSPQFGGGALSIGR